MEIRFEFEASVFNQERLSYCRAVVSRGASLKFGSSINTIPTRGGRLCPPNYPWIRKPNNISVLYLVPLLPYSTCSHNFWSTWWKIFRHVIQLKFTTGVICCCQKPILGRFLALNISIKTTPPCL